jgi:hypothetical protein
MVACLHCCGTKESIDLEAAMILWKRFILLTVGMSAVGLAGCSGRAASPGKNVRRSAAAATGGTQRGAAKTTPREAAFSVYNEPEYGVSFRYPRNYALEEGELGEPIPGARSQAELADEQPEAVLLATVVIPEDAYPNTTFVAGSLQFAVDASLMPGSCKELLIDPENSVGRKTGTLGVEGVLFHWTEVTTTTADAGTDTESVERDYAGYANGACYEFFAHVEVGETANSDGLEKQADAKKILRHLEKIVASLQCEEKRAVAAGEKAPE